MSAGSVEAAGLFKADSRSRSEKNKNLRMDLDVFMLNAVRAFPNLPVECLDALVAALQPRDRLRFLGMVSVFASGVLVVIVHVGGII